MLQCTHQIVASSRGILTMWWICRTPVGKFCIRLCLLLTIVLGLIIGLGTLLIHPTGVKLRSRDERSPHHPEARPKQVSFQHKNEFSDNLRKISKNNGKHRKIVKERIIPDRIEPEMTTLQNVSKMVKADEGKSQQSHKIKDKAPKGQGQEKVQKQTLKIVIVEEHHEVLPYWYKLANKKTKVNKGKATPYTLVHFDAHSDFGPMSYNPRLPLFRQPKSKQEVARLMQRNDVFIIASIATRLVDRFIWVWPDWAAKEYQEMYGNHTNGSVSVGTFTYTENSTAPTTGMCVCMSQVYKDGHPKKLFKERLNGECLFARPELEPYLLPGVDCNVSIKNIPFDFVRENFMLDHGRQLLHSINRDDIILDIDEDYFSCENSANELVKSGIHWSIVEEINKKIAPLFCPRSVKHEERLAGVIPFLLTSSCYSPLDSTCVTTAESDLAIVRQTTCHGVHDLNKKVGGLRSFFHNNLTKTQRNLMLEVGFCMRTSPNTARIAVDKEDNSMAVCIGENIPDSGGLYFTPSSSQLSTNMATVSKLVSRLKNMSLVTIARSNRDGFVSRSSQEQIESKVITLVKDYGNKHKLNTSVEYDAQLMRNKLHRDCVT